MQFVTKLFSCEQQTSASVCWFPSEPVLYSRMHSLGQRWGKEWWNLPLQSIAFFHLFCCSLHHLAAIRAPCHICYKQLVKVLCEFSVAHCFNEMLVLPESLNAFLVTKLRPQFDTGTKAAARFAAVREGANSAPALPAPPARKAHCWSCCPFEAVVNSADNCVRSLVFSLTYNGVCLFV